MSGNTNFPTALDDDSSLFNVSDGVSTVQASHHNNLKEALKAIEKKVGIDLTSSPTSLDFRLGDPTTSHRHDGASGQGQKIAASSIQIASGALVPGRRQYALSAHLVGTAIVGANAGFPFSIGRTAILESVRANLRRGPSGATTAFDVNIGPTSIWTATQGDRPIFAPGATNYGHASPNLVTAPSGAIFTIDVDAVGSNDPGRDLTLVFVFREN